MDFTNEDKKNLLEDLHKLKWWNDLSNKDKIKYAEEEQWTTPDQLSEYQICQIYDARINDNEY